MIDIELDKKWSKLVKLKAGLKCEYCGCINNLQSHHIFSRKNKSTRWDVSNGICLCFEHHIASSVFSAHKTPLKFAKWFKTYKGDDFFLNLKLKSNKIKKLYKNDKKVILTNLKNEIKKVQV